MASDDERRNGVLTAALLAPSFLVLLLLLFAPLLFLLSYSFAPGGSTQADFQHGLTLENYEILGDWFYLAIILNTVWLSLIVTAASVAIGWPLAYFLWQVRARWKPILTLAVIAPLLISIPVRNYGWMVILGDTGLINKALVATGLLARPVQLMYTNFAIVLGLTHVLMSFVVLSVRACLERICDNLSEAARTLGASRFETICLVILPLSMPGVLAGATLVFCVAASAYVTPTIMGPSGAKYSATLVYQQFVSVFDWPRGSAIATIILIITVAALFGIVGAFNRPYGRPFRST